MFGWDDLGIILSAREETISWWFSTGEIDAAPAAVEFWTSLSIDPSPTSAHFPIEQRRRGENRSHSVAIGPFGSSPPLAVILARGGITYK
jgi:hypothetical protein